MKNWTKILSNYVQKFCIVILIVGNSNSDNDDDDDNCFDYINEKELLLIHE
jgi:hypothetical protein